MRFSDPPRRKPSDSIVPMINVVFLLLIFFLMTAQIAPPFPIDVSPPTAQEAGAPAEADLTLYLSADGALAFEDATGPAALRALARAREPICAGGPWPCTDTAPPLILRADGSASGAALARLMGQLAEAGFAQVQLVTVPK
ncbi:ExbD/TolR family protein [Roseovarius sp. S1116L3]|uniref:ExbD/TolR family protein n=1 Tax=Roseovarius roseus TaxID=3342636 RepID=UPI0037277DA7